MRRLLPLLGLVLLFMASCSEDINLPVDNDNGKSELNLEKSTRVVSDQQAKAFAEQAVLALMNFDTPMTEEVVTRSSGTQLGVESIITLDGTNNTPAMYVVNFTENNGYMIVSADKESTNPLLFYADNGKFDQKTLNEDSPFASYLNEKLETISANLAANVINEDKINAYEMWEYLVEEESDEDEITITTIELVSLESIFDDVKFDVVEDRLKMIEEIEEDGPFTRGRHKWQRGFKYVSPRYAQTLNWGQDKGYNADAPRPNVDLAGCPAIAIGQLCFTHRYPSKYEYSSMPTVLPSNTRTSNPISRMLRDVANNIPGYRWGANASGAEGIPIQTGLRNLGYRSATWTDYDFIKAYWNMHDGYPVLLGGFQNGGHIWYCNGYQEFVWLVKKYKKKFLGKKKLVDQWYEYADYVYMNWGWHGQDNGWVDQEDWGKYNNQRKMWYNLFPR